MTTVLVSRGKGKVFTDSRWTAPDGYYEDNAIKRWKLDNKRTVYGCGYVDEIERVLPYLRAGLPIRLKNSKIVVIKDGTKDVYLYEPNMITFLGFTLYRDSVCEEITTEHIAMGSGARYLWGRLHSGFSVMDAFQQVYLQDIYSGGEISTWEL